MAERVSMNWPEGLKDKVRDKVGARGVTDFAIAAVERQLLEGDVVGEARGLAQTFADMLQNNGHPINGQIPEWLTLRAGSATSEPTIVAPEERQAKGSLEEDIQRVRVEGVVRRDVRDEPAPEVEVVAVVPAPVQPETPTVIPQAEDGSWVGPRGSSTETLDELQNKAKTLGINLGPASAIVKDAQPNYEQVDDVPVPTTPPEEPMTMKGRPVESVDLPGDPEQGTQAPGGFENAGVCDECGEPLDASGECWNVHF